MKFQNVKVGDKLWSIQLGECTVDDIRTGHTYQIKCSNEKGISAEYTLGGYWLEDDYYPSLFYSKPEISEPKRKVTKTVEVWVNISNVGNIRVSCYEEQIDKIILPNDKVQKTKGTLTYETEE